MTPRHLKERSGADSPEGAVGQTCPGVCGIEVVVTPSWRWDSKLEATVGGLETERGPPVKAGWSVSHVMNIGYICKEASMGSPSHPEKSTKRWCFYTDRNCSQGKSNPSPKTKRAGIASLSAQVCFYFSTKCMWSKLKWRERRKSNLSAMTTWWPGHVQLPVTRLSDEVFPEVLPIGQLWSLTRVVGWQTQWDLGDWTCYLMACYLWVLRT